MKLGGIERFKVEDDLKQHGCTGQWRTGQFLIYVHMLPALIGRTDKKYLFPLRMEIICRKQCRSRIEKGF